MKVLVVDHNGKHRSLLYSFLEQHLCVVDACGSVKEGSYLCRTNHYDAIVSAFALGDLTALALCTAIRSAGSTIPILVYSFSIPVPDRIRLFEAGIDDLILRPFSFEELMARLRAIARRGLHLQEEILVAGNLVLNRAAQRVFLKGKAVILAAKEFQVLELLMQRQGFIVTRVTFYERIWGMATDEFSTTLESHIYNLRRKINGASVAIETVIGSGYRLA